MYFDVKKKVFANLFLGGCKIAKKQSEEVCFC